MRFSRLHFFIRSFPCFWEYALFALALVILNACGNGANEHADTGKALRIVTTIFLEYDWVRPILGDKANDADLTLLLDSGVNLHSYQPTIEDMVKISSCDLFVYFHSYVDDNGSLAVRDSVRCGGGRVCLVLS